RITPVGPDPNMRASSAIDVLSVSSSIGVVLNGAVIVVARETDSAVWMDCSAGFLVVEPSPHALTSAITPKRRIAAFTAERGPYTSGVLTRLGRAQLEWRLA